ncbi:MAG: SRPBCC family protein [Mycobacteriales bacterium]
MDIGSYLEYDGKPAVRFERTYAAPVDRVWRAVSTPAGLEHWFPSAVEIEARPGGVIRFIGDPNVDDREGTVVEFEPPRRLAFTWGDNVLHISVEALADSRTRLVLIDVLGERGEAARNAAGWTVCLAELDKGIAGTPGEGPHSPTAESWQQAYDRYVQGGMPAGADIPAAT